jgi:hypothetical protein
MVAQFGAEGALDQGLLASARNTLDLRRRQRAVPDDLVENVSRDWRQDLGARLLGFRFAGHTASSCYALHTKFPTGSATVRDMRGIGDMADPCFTE